MFRSVCGATSATEAKWTQPPAHHQHKDECTPTAQELSAHLTKKATEPGLLLACSIAHLGECLSNICTSLGPRQSQLMKWAQL